VSGAQHGHARRPDESASAAPHIARLTLFPVKGLKGIDVAERRLGPRGLEGDRRWMVVNRTGTFLSQRTHPRMILVETALVEGESGDALVLATRGMPELELAARPLEAGADTLRVEIWGDVLDAVAPSPEADAWLSEALDEPVRLVYQPDRARRPTDPQYAPGAEVSFADGYPVLLLTEASLGELNRRLDAPVPMDRFRPNVVVAGVPEPNAEDRWRRIRLGGVECRGVKLCGRCAVTTVDTRTAEKGKEPLRTLATYRGWGGKVWFGQNVVPDAEGMLRVGDPVTVLEEGAVGP
jgi:uncharacterized protein